MELYIAGAVIGLGYILSGNKNKKNVPLAKIPSKNIPNGDNIFNSNRVQEIRLKEQQISDKKYEQVFGDSPKDEDSNLVVPGPPQPYFNKVDYVDNTLPIEFEDNPPRINIGEPTIDPTDKHYGSGHPTGNPVSDDWYGVSLTGEPIDPKAFTHNNMTPFFGSHVRQNVDEYTNTNIIESFTGQKSFEKRKTEISQMFDPEANIRNPYGMSNLSGYQRERYIVSNRRNNEAPTEKIYVGPGLNRGYTWYPSGGFQQAETRDYILPKTVDELRVKTNPKLTYNVPIIPGSNLQDLQKLVLCKRTDQTGLQFGHLIDTLSLLEIGSNPNKDQKLFLNIVTEQPQILEEPWVLLVLKKVLHKKVFVQIFVLVKNVNIHLVVHVALTGLVSGQFQKVVLNLKMVVMYQCVNVTVVNFHK